MVVRRADLVPLLAGQLQLDHVITLARLMRHRGRNTAKPVASRPALVAHPVQRAQGGGVHVGAGIALDVLVRHRITTDLTAGLQRALGNFHSASGFRFSWQPRVVGCPNAGNMPRPEIWENVSLHLRMT